MRLKILYINEFLYSPEGCSLHARKIIEELEKLENQVIVYPVQTDKVSHRGYKVHKIVSFIKTKLPLILIEFSIFFKKIIRFLFWLRHILRIIKKEKIDCILIRPGLYDYSAVFLKKILKTTIILEVNAPLFLERSIYYRMKGKRIAFFNYFQSLELLLWKNVDSVYVVSETLKEFMKSYLKENSPLMRVILNGVSLEDFNDDANVDENLNCIKICFMGSFLPWHGADLLFESFLDIVNLRPKTQLLFIGDGEGRRELVRKTSKIKDLPMSVIFLGKLSHKKTIDTLKTVHIVVAPYLNQEVFYFSPLKLFEYMAAKKAIVATRFGQIKDILEDGKDALLINENKKELSEALLKLIDSKHLRDKLGQSAFEKVKNYTWEKSAWKVQELIKESINLSGVYHENSPNK